MFFGVEWAERNARHKRDYTAAVAEVLPQRGYDAAGVEAAAAVVQGELRGLDVTVKRGRLRPPKEK